MSSHQSSEVSHPFHGGFEDHRRKSKKSAQHRGEAQQCELTGTAGGREDPQARMGAGCCETPEDRLRGRGTFAGGCSSSGSWPWDSCPASIRPVLSSPGIGGQVAPAPAPLWFTLVRALPS